MASLSYVTHSAAGHQIINPFGQVVCVSRGTLKALDMRGYLHRDSITGLKGMDPKQYLIFVDAERGTDHFYELGEDCSGPNQVICRCDECTGKRGTEADLDNTPMPGRNPLQDDEISRIVADVKRKRKQ